MERTGTIAVSHGHVGVIVLCSAIAECTGGRLSPCTKTKGGLGCPVSHPGHGETRLR
jgi:hypothetical protein